jgi:signal transduction histidine kinase
MSTKTLWEQYRDLDNRNPYLRMGLVALIMLVFLYLDLRVKPEPGSGHVQEELPGVILGILQVLPVIFVRKMPLLSLSIIFAAFVTHSAFDHQVLWVAQFSTLISLFILTGQSSDRTSIIAGVMSFVVIVVVFGIMREDVDAAIALILLFIAVWTVGNVVKSRHMRLEAAGQVIADLPDEQGRVSQEAIRGERTRIARELHDVLGHTLNLVVIQAGAAQRIYESSPEKALEAVKSIESTSRQALSDVDRMLGILRDPDEAANPAPSLEARPSLSRINNLISELKSAGQPLELVLTGEVTTLLASTDLTAYRVVQEALTNVMTHASGSKAKVEIDYAENQLEVTIINDGAGMDTLAGRKSGGRGIVGMRERTSLFGGKFEAGSTDDGGWRVNATFPISRDNTVTESEE